MPVITIQISKQSEETKKQLIDRLSEEASKATGISKEKFIVMVDELPVENIGVGGVPLSKII